MAEFSRGPNLLAQQAAQYQTPSTMPLIQKSQYLAQALQQMQESGQNSKNWGALGANLIAQALYNSADRDNNAALYNATNQAQDQRAQTAWAAMAPQDGNGQSMPMPTITHAPYKQPGGDIVEAIQGLFKGRGGQPAAPAPAMPSQSPVDTSALASTLQGGQPPMSAPQIAPAPSGGPSAPITSTDSLVAALGGNTRGARNNNPLNVTALGNGQMWNGQTGVDGSYAKFGSPDAGMKAADTNLANYGKLHGINTLSGIINRWAPASGGNNPAAYTQTVAQSLGIDPNAQIDLSDPSMRQRILRGMASVESPGALSASQAAPSVGVNTGAGGPGPGVAPPPPGPGGQPQMMQGQQQFQQPVPANQMYGGAGASPRELAQIRMQLTGSPMDQQMAQQKMWEIAQRQATPIGPKDTAYIGADGQLHSARPYSAATNGPAPGTMQQTDFDGQQKISEIPHAVQNGQLYNPQTRSYEPLRQSTYQVQGMPNGQGSPLAAGTNGQAGQPQPKQNLTPLALLIQRDPVSGEAKTDPRFESMIGLRKEATNNEIYNNYQEAQAALGGLTRTIDSMAGPNGVLSQAALDTEFRTLNPKGSVRQGPVNMFLDHMGVAGKLKSFLSEQYGQGPITPEVMRNMVTSAQAYTGQLRAQAQAKMDDAEHFANQTGVTLGLDALPEVSRPTAPWYTGGNGSAPNSQPGGGGAHSPSSGMGGQAYNSPIAGIPYGSNQPQGQPNVQARQAPPPAVSPTLAAIQQAAAAGNPKARAYLQHLQNTGISGQQLSPVMSAMNPFAGVPR